MGEVPRQRVVPLGFLLVQGFDGYRVRAAGCRASDFVQVHLFRDPVDAPMRPDAINGPQWGRGAGSSGTDREPAQLASQGTDGAADVPVDACNPTAEKPWACVQVSGGGR